ncbi:MAG: hypothetical protein N2037_00590, partial [Acidimicrobiales bacterium]|nr:hypothetical protein [Acidimicrobiales bacterium]
MPLARRNLFEDRRRSALALAGVASGLVMVLVMTGVYAGFLRQETSYIDSIGADLVISQSGVRTCLLYTS